MDEGCRLRHYDAGRRLAYPPKGDIKPWPGFAEDFDVKAFVDKVRDMGGKYIVWSATLVVFFLHQSKL